MGSSTSLLSRQIKVKGDDIDDMLIKLGGATHQYLGRIQIYKVKDKPAKVFSKTSRTTSRQDIHEKEHQQRDALYHRNLLQYWGCSYSYFSMGDLQETTLYYEYIPMSLAAISQQQKNIGTAITEEDTWKIIQQIQEVATYLESFQLHHGNISLDSIFVDKDLQIKVLYHQAYNELISSYAKVLGGIKDFCLSPQQVVDLSQKKTVPSDDPQKSDSFQFGMVLLELLSKEESKKYYDFQQCVIYYNRIQTAINKLTGRYSQHLIDYLQSLLRYDESMRPRLTESRTNRFAQPKFSLDLHSQISFRQSTDIVVSRQQSPNIIISRQLSPNIINRQYSPLAQVTPLRSAPLKISSPKRVSPIGVSSFTSKLASPSLQKVAAGHMAFSITKTYKQKPVQWSNPQISICQLLTKTPVSKFIPDENFHLTSSQLHTPIKDKPQIPKSTAGANTTFQTPKRISSSGCPRSRPLK